VLDEIAATGYGLTSGIHSRIDETVRYIRPGCMSAHLLNRNMIGPSSGCSLGGEGCRHRPSRRPRYLHRFATERTLSIDTTAAGGNAPVVIAGGKEAVAT